MWRFWIKKEYGVFEKAKEVKHDWNDVKEGHRIMNKILGHEKDLAFIFRAI